MDVDAGQGLRQTDGPSPTPPAKEKGGWAAGGPAHICNGSVTLAVLGEVGALGTGDGGSTPAERAFSVASRLCGSVRRGLVL